jgi:acyl-CoA thioesterase I
MDDAVAARRKRAIMRDQHEGGAVPGAQIEHEVDHLAAGVAVEIAGWLVGEQQLRLDDEGARQRHALLLAARQLLGIMQQAVREPDGLQRVARPRRGVAPSGELERDRDIFQRVHHRHEAKGLEDDADRATSPQSERILVEGAEIGSRDAHHAAGRALEAAHHHHHGRFAGAGRADHADALARRHIERNAAQHVDLAGGARQLKMDLIEMDHAKGRGKVAGSRAGTKAYGAIRHGINAFLLALMLLASPAADAAGSAKTLLVFGDSLSAGYGLPADQGFIAKLGAALKSAGYDITVVNGSVSGDTSAGGLARLDWSLGDHPDFALVELGANDALRGLDPKAMEANLDAILGKLAARKVPALLAGMYAPRNLGRDYDEAFDGAFPRLAAKHGVPLYPFFLDGVATDPALSQPDGLHPNAQGVDVIVAKIMPYVTRLLDGAARAG